MAIEVYLTDHTTNPAKSLYLAYRTAVTAKSPKDILDDIESMKLTQEYMMEFVTTRMEEAGHSSPLEQVWFEFSISGVSRSFSHQFVRHHMGISFEQQSQRVVMFKDGEFPYVIPPTVNGDWHARDEFVDAMEDAGKHYDHLIKVGVPAEDARFVIPQASTTNFKVVVNYIEMLHIADQRLCTRAQWEFRKVVALMRAEIKREFPYLARFIQPKCGEHRLGYCDEKYETWAACPLGGLNMPALRPHKRAVIAMGRGIEGEGDFAV